MAGFYAVWHGPAGLREIATDIHGRAVSLAVALSEAGLTLAHDTFFDTVTVQVSSADEIIAKAAEDSSMTPTNQYFLTLSSDGTYLSSDFYLRLTGKVTRLVQGLDAPSATVPIAPSNGPVWFRSGSEEVDAALTWAKKLPVGDGSVEIRPVAMMPDESGTPRTVN